MNKKRIREALFGLLALVLACVGIFNFYLCIETKELLFRVVFLMQWLFFNGAAIYAIEIDGKHSFFIDEEDDDEYDEFFN